MSTQTVTIKLENAYRKQLLTVTFAGEGYVQPSGLASEGAAREAAQLLLWASVGDSVELPFSAHRLAELVDPVVERIRANSSKNSEHVVAEGEALLDELREAGGES